MDSSRPKRELWIYGLVFLLALALRLIRLGVFPLTDLEAIPALQALQAAQGARPLIGPNSAYVLLTSLFFFVFEGTNFLARLAPALAGAFLIFVPYLFRRHLGPRAAVLLAIFLAVDPGLLAVSRQAGSSMLAVTFLLFAWGFMQQASWKLAGMFAALAVLGGPAVWAGALGLGLSWAILQSMERGSPIEDPEQEEAAPGSAEPSDVEPPREATARRTALTAFGLTFVLFGTMMFLIPGGVNGALDAIIQYARGWVTSSGVPGRLVFFSLFLYQPLVIILAVIALVRGLIAGSRQTIRMGVWMLVALLLAVFYPAHQVHDLVWALIPLSALAAIELSRHLDIEQQERLEVGGVVLLVVVVLGFSWLDLASLPWNAASAGQSNLRIWLFFGAIFLLVISLLLVAVGWSARTARLGAVWGAVAFFALISLSAGLAAGRLRANYTSELWGAGPYPVQIDLLASSVSDLSEWGMGQVDAAPVTFLQNDFPALRWALRGHDISVVQGLDAASSPPVVITPYADSLGLSAPYRGQDFTWNQTPNWSAALPGDWLRWMVLRDMPQKYETIMLWVRDDLFLDSPSRSFR